ncbi:MAG: hypothetical protein WBA83_10660 [Burkholderiaceae bacterium]
MLMRGSIRRSLSAWLLALAAVAGLGACSTTGNSFDSSSIPLLVAGRTTLGEASRLLHAEPTNVYRQQDGSALAIWSHKLTLATDAVYFNQELWLAFGPDGRFQRIAKSVNIPRAYEYGEQNQSVPYDPRVRQAPPAAAAAHTEHSTGLAAADGGDPAPTHDALLSGVIPQPAHTYPVAQ